MKESFSFDPFADLQNYREAIRQMFEAGWVLPRDLMPSAMNAIVVPVDVIDNGPEILVKASLPGVRPEDVMLTVLGDTLTIKAEVPDEEDMRGATYLRHERRTLSYVRSITLPMPVESERSEARFKNGVLTLVLPKSASVRPRVIKVTNG